MLHCFIIKPDSCVKNSPPTFRLETISTLAFLLQFLQVYLQTIFLPTFILETTHRLTNVLQPPALPPNVFKTNISTSASPTTHNWRRKPSKNNYFLYEERNSLTVDGNRNRSARQPPPPSSPLYNVETYPVANALPKERARPTLERGVKGEVTKKQTD